MSSKFLEETVETNCPNKQIGSSTNFTVLSCHERLDKSSWVFIVEAISNQDLADESLRSIVYVLYEEVRGVLEL